jgi:hypothetical protein
VSAIEGYADRLSSSMGGAQRLTGAASGLAGAASGLAGASFAHRMLGSDAESSEENFMKEVRERFDLIDERLHQLEDQMRALREGGDPGNLQERGDEPDTGGDR